MTIYISPFILGVICTVGAEILTLIIAIIISTITHNLKTRRNASK